MEEDTRTKLLVAKISTLNSSSAFNRIKRYIETTHNKKMIIASSSHEKYPESVTEEENKLYVIFTKRDKRFKDLCLKYAQYHEAKAILIENICIVNESLVICEIDDEDDINISLRNTIETYKIYEDMPEHDKNGSIYDIAETDEKITEEEKRILVYLSVSLKRKVKESKNEYERQKLKIDKLKRILIDEEERQESTKIALKRRELLIGSNSKGVIFEVLQSFKKLEEAKIINNIEFGKESISGIIKDIVIKVDYSNNDARTRAENKGALDELRKYVDARSIVYYYVGDIKVSVGYSSTTANASLVTAGLDKLGYQEQASVSGYHPHISGPSICLGSRGGSRFRSLISEMKLPEAFKMISLALRTYSPSNPYGSLLEKYYKPYETHEECLKNGIKKSKKETT